jgi:hypothetical protein
MRIEGFKMMNPNKENQVLIEFGPAEMTVQEFIELVAAMLGKLPEVATQIISQIRKDK